MLNARALFYALFLSLLIAMISGLLIGLSYLQRLQQIDQVEQERAMKNVKSAISLLRQDTRPMSSQQIDLYGDGLDSAQIGRYPWGLFTLAHASAHYQSDTFSKAFFLGEAHQPSLQSALYLEDHNAPLAVVGNTEVRGLVYLPQAGVKRGYIKGKGYTGAELIYGKVENSNKTLPKISAERMEQLLPYFKASGQAEIPATGISQSFFDSTRYLSGDHLLLEDLQLHGNIIVVAQSSIYVGADADLDNVLLFAPEITFAPGFRGRVQAFATRKIDLGEAARLAYPSVLGLVLNDETEQRKLLLLRDAAEVHGLVFIHQGKVHRHQPLLSIGEKCHLEGQVWADAYVDINGGTLYGNMTCKSFWLAAGSSTYTNHIMDAVIDREKMQADYISPVFTGALRAGGIAQWVK